MWYNMYIMQFNEIVTTAAEPTVLKILTASLVSLTFFLFGDLHTQAITAVLMLVLLDTVFGVVSAYQNGIQITSRRFSRIVQKSIVYLLAISAGYFTDVTIGWHLVQSTMIAFIGVTECISILEKMGQLGYATPQRLLNQLQEFKGNK
jgi:toxin secretion/phage lysis holin